VSYTVINLKYTVSTWNTLYVSFRLNQDLDLEVCLFIKYNFILTYLDQRLTDQKQSHPNSSIESILRSQISNVKFIHRKTSGKPHLSMLERNAAATLRRRGGSLNPSTTRFLSEVEGQDKCNRRVKGSKGSASRPSPKNNCTVYPKCYTNYTN
jgi:hypothetical protein